MNTVTDNYTTESGNTYIIDATYTYKPSPATREYPDESEIEIEFKIFHEPEGDDAIELNEALVEGSDYWQKIVDMCIEHYEEGIL